MRSVTLLREIKRNILIANKTDDYKTNSNLQTTKHKTKTLRKIDLTKTQSASEDSVEFVSVFGRFTNGKNKYYLMISELNYTGWDCGYDNCIIYVLFVIRYSKYVTRITLVAFKLSKELLQL